MQNLISDFLESLKLEGKTDSTTAEYHRRINIFIRYLNQLGLSFEDVNQQTLIGFRTHLLKKKLNNRTINGIFSTLNVLNNWMLLNEYIEINPVHPGLHLKPKNKRIERISDADLETFIAWINTLQENLQTAFWLMYGSGARVSEVANLTAADVTIKDSAVYINIKDAKWGSDRNVPIMDKEAAERVWKYRVASDITGMPLFRVSNRTLQTYATQFAQTTGITFHCHLLRHTYAARLLEGGLPITTIQFLLGHKTLNMTAHYTQSAKIDVSNIVPTIYQERGNQNE